MSQAAFQAPAAGTDPYKLGSSRKLRGTGGGGHGHGGHGEPTGHGEGGPASPRVIVGYGFWIFLLSDIIMFSAFFAASAQIWRAA